MRAACAVRGIEITAVVWDDPNLDVSAFDALVIGTTWDYTSRPDAFLAVLEGMAAVRPLFNPIHVVRWNFRKTYLMDLKSEGVPVVDTLWCDRADGKSIESAFADLDVDEIVVKPLVGAGAWRQARLRKGDPLPPADDLPQGAALIQPFLPSAVDEGEYSFIFFGRTFSHCARKIPQAGDYRVQSIYGGYERVHKPSDLEVQSARRVLDAVEGDLLYARVDMMRDLKGHLVLMELELIEPYLYPEQGPNMGEAFAAALGHKLRLNAPGR